MNHIINNPVENYPKGNEACYAQRKLEGQNWKHMSPEIELA